MFLTDDFAARRLAQREGVAISGTIGLLRKLVALHLTLEEADRMLAIMLRPRLSGADPITARAVMVATRLRLPVSPQLLPSPKRPRPLHVARCAAAIGFDLLLRQLPHSLGGHAQNQRVRRVTLAFGQQRTHADDRVLPHLGPVEQHGADADDAVVADPRAVYHRAVADSNPSPITQG